MSSSSAASSHTDSALTVFARTLRATPLLRFVVERRSARATPLDNDPWNEPGGMSDEMERAFIARESRRW